MSGFDIANFASGALVEQIDFELQKVLENIADPNTDAKKARKITITLTFQPNEKRNLSKVSFQTKSTLVPANSIETEILIDKDKTGRIVAAELRGIPGQLELTETGQIRENKVINIRG